MNASTFKTKTFWAALLSILGAVGGAVTHTVDYGTAAQMVITSVLAACVRDGVTTEVAKK